MVQIEVVATFLVILGVYIDIYPPSKWSGVKIPMLVNWSCGSPNNVDDWAQNGYCILSTWFDIRVWWREVAELGVSNLHNGGLTLGSKTKETPNPSWIYWSKTQGVYSMVRKFKYWKWSVVNVAITIPSNLGTPSFKKLLLQVWVQSWVQMKVHCVCVCFNPPPPLSVAQI